MVQFNIEFISLYDVNLMASILWFLIGKFFCFLFFWLLRFFRLFQGFRGIFRAYGREDGVCLRFVIAAFLFLWFLENNRILYRADGSRLVDNNTLVALTLMIAESRTEEKDVMTKVVVNLINKNN